MEQVQITKSPIASSENIQIGYIYELKGSFVYGVPVSLIQKIRTAVSEIKHLALSEVVALDISHLTKWDSLGVTSVIEPLIEANDLLSKKGRTPIYLIGDRKSDNYLAARDKYPNINDSAQLPWCVSVEEWKKIVMP